MTPVAEAPRRDAVYRASLAANLGLVYFAVLSFPSLVDLPSSVTPGHLLMLGSFPIWFAAALARERMVFDRAATLASLAILACTALLIFWTMLSAFQAEDPFRAARSGVSLFTAFSIFAMVAGTVTRQRLGAYVAVLCLALAATSVLTVAAFAEPTLQAVIFQGRDRAFGFFKNPNQFGIAISSVVPVALAMLFAARRHRALWAACVLFLLLGLMATGSKANLLVSAVSLPSCLVLFSLISYSGPKRLVMLIATVFGCLVAGGFVIAALSVLNPRALSLLGDLVVEGEATHSLVSRSLIWADSLSLLKSNPVFGVGAGQPIHGLSHSHNVILEYARTLGVPGLVFITVKLAVIMAVCGSTMLLALRSGAASLSDRYVCIGLAFGPVAYVGANFSSDSLGPTTSPFLYSVLFLGLASRSLLQSGAPVSADPGAVDAIFDPQRIAGPGAEPA